MTTRLLVACLLGAVTLTAQSPELRSGDGKDKFLGNLNANKYDPDSVANPYGRYGSPYSPDSVNNPYGRYGSPYSNESAKNPYAARPPVIVTPDGKYLGKYSANRLDPKSVSNPLGRYGSELSPASINNRLGRYGSVYSRDSARNPYGHGARKEWRQGRAGEEKHQ